MQNKNNNLKKVKVAFMGTPEFAVHSLQALIDDKYDIIAVFTAPDRKKGRGQQISFSPVKQAALDNNIPVMQPVRIKKTEWVEKIKELQPDIIIVAAFGQIIPQSILDIPTYGCVNVHASLLPKYRGAAPIHYALRNGDKETGITIMKMEAGLDTGDIITNDKLQITNNDNLETLHDKLAVMGANLLIKTLPDYIGGKIQPIKQDESRATVTERLKKEDGRIDWHKSGPEIVNMVRAFNPWPGTFTQWEGKYLKIIAAESSDEKLSPGEVKIDDDQIYIGTADFAVKIIKLQLAGKKTVTASEFSRSGQMRDGHYLI
ncbi:MAG: methionyl-tRNA formyltransferase [Patescibacteria group bacterium]